MPRRVSRFLDGVRLVDLIHTDILQTSKQCVVLECAAIVGHNIKELDKYGGGNTCCMHLIHCTYHFLVSKL